MSLNEKLFHDLNIEDLNTRVKNATGIVITAHKSPDGDAVGSTMALWNVLNKMGIKSTVILPDEFPSSLGWMSGTKECVFYNSQKEKADELFKKADVIFCLDYNDFSRTGEMKEVLKEAKGYKIMIDHHPNPSNEFNILLSDTTECSTAQMIYQFVVKMGWGNFLNKQGAECIYCGIMTDTGSFRYSTTSTRTHLILAALLEKGVRSEEVHGAVFDNDSETRLKLLGYALSSKMKVLRDLKTAYIILSEEELHRYDFQPGDTEGFVNYGLSVKGIQMAAIFIEKGKLVKCSFRSKGTLPVNNFSGKYFNGGGHVNAAGGAYEGSLADAEKIFLENLPDFIHANFK